MVAPCAWTCARSSRRLEVLRVCYRVNAPQSLATECTHSITSQSSHDVFNLATDLASALISPAPRPRTLFCIEIGGIIMAWAALVMLSAMHIANGAFLLRRDGPPYGHPNIIYCDVAVSPWHDQQIGIRCRDMRALVTSD